MYRQWNFMPQNIYAREAMNINSVILFSFKTKFEKSRLPISGEKYFIRIWIPIHIPKVMNSEIDLWGNLPHVNRTMVLDFLNAIKGS